jgi:hypothetical protein
LGDHEFEFVLVEFVGRSDQRGSLS